VITETLAFENVSDDGPRSTVYAGGYLWLGLIHNSDSGVRVHRWDGSGWNSALLETSANNDVHNNPGIFVDRDGYVFAMATRHTTGSEIRIYKSATPYGLDFGSPQVLTVSTPAYPQMVQTADGRLWLFFNYNGSSTRDIGYRTSDDGGATWSSTVLLWQSATSNRAYFVPEIVAGEIVLTTTTRNPYDSPNAGNDMWILRYANGAWRNMAGSTYTLPVSISTGERVFNAATADINAGFPGGGWSVDADGRWFVAIAVNNTSAVTGVYLLRYDGAWTQAQILDTATSGVNAGRILCRGRGLYEFLGTRLVSGATQYAIWHSADNGATWTAEPLTDSVPSRSRRVPRSVERMVSEVSCVTRRGTRDSSTTWDMDYYLPWPRIEPTHRLLRGGWAFAAPRRTDDGNWAASGVKRNLRGAWA